MSRPTVEIRPINRATLPEVAVENGADIQPVKFGEDEHFEGIVWHR